MNTSPTTVGDQETRLVLGQKQLTSDKISFYLKKDGGRKKTWTFDQHTNENCEL